MLSLLLQTIYLFLPAYVANMAPVIGNHFNLLPFLATPLDRLLPRPYKNKPIFGKNKTLRGFILATTLGTTAALIQIILNPLIPNPIKLLTYNNQYLLTGFLISLGAITGDAVESFFKRRANVPTGQPLFPFDYLDYTLGSIILARLYLSIPATTLLTAIALNTLTTPLFNLLTVKLHLKQSL